MRKKLLSEAQVRRFQTLATIKPLNEMEDKDYKENLYEEEDFEADAEDPEMGEADVEMDEELVQKFMDAVDTMQQVADVLNPEGNIGAMDDEGGMDFDMDAMDDAGEEPIELDDADEEEYIP